MKYLLTFIVTCCAAPCMAQSFSTDIKTAKASYASGKLEDAHFALLQAMQEVDLIIGKEVLKLMPAKMDTYTVNAKDDNVTSNVGFVGTTIRRSYGPESNADISIIGNSPIISTLNAFLNTPLLGGMMSNGKNKIIKVQGYKGQMTKEDNGSGQTNYSVQLPIGNSLITFAAKNSTDAKIVELMNSIPLQQIAKLLQ